MMKAMHQNENPYADRNLDFEAYSMLYGKPFLDMISRKDFDMDFLDSDEDLFDEATESQLFLGWWKFFFKTSVLTCLFL